MKKVVVFSSKGGGGHVAVSNALQQYLNDDYSIETNNIFTQVLGPLDFLSRSTGGKVSAENIYNICIARKWYSFLNGYHKMGGWFYYLLQKKAQTLIHQYLDEQKPDLIVSVVPLINNIILEVAKQRSIPFLLIPTDLDISSCLTNINQPVYEKFKIAIPFDDKAIQEKISSARIPDQSCVTTGFLLRPDFFEEKDSTPIKFGYGVPEKKPTVLLLLGAVGSHAIYSFVEQLARVEYPCHILICIGKQIQLKTKIESLEFPNHVSYTIVEFTPRISDLMAISDLLITKSGSVSVNEAIYMNLPMILDATSNVLKW
ncbi:MAG: glycosyltransferase, partial [Candidatus Babeliales bacterium]|nr:glycosyltransferase [Candidatus Babeliales bacterium]